MHACTARCLVSLQTSLRTAYKSRSLSLIPSNHSKGISSRPPYIFPIGRVPVRFASKQDGGDATSGPLKTAEDDADNFIAEEADASGDSEISPQVVSGSSEEQVFGSDVSDNESTLDVKPAASEQGTLADSMPEESDVDIFKDSTAHTRIPRVPSDSDLYGMRVDPLPPLPPRPEYPVPQIIESELHDHIIPLYSRKWIVKYLFKMGVLDTKNWYKSAILCRKYNFATFEATMDFVTELARLAQVEDHFPSIAFEHTEVYVNSCTFSAFRNASRPSEHLDERQRPGLTLRDARFATLAEDTFARHFLANGHGLPGDVEVPHDYQLPRSIAMLERSTQPGKVRKNNAESSVDFLKPEMRQGCRVCGAKHNPLFCPQRYTKPPPQKSRCRYCGELGHWSMNCPQTNQDLPPPPPPPYGEGVPPPCPICGGGHWKTDCQSFKPKKKKSRQPVHQPPLLSLYDVDTT